MRVSLLLLIVCCALALEPVVEWRAEDWAENRWPSSTGGLTLVGNDGGHRSRRDHDDDDGTSACPAWVPIETLLSGYNRSVVARLRSARALSIELVLRAQKNHANDAPTGSYSRIFGVSADVLCPSTLDTSIGQRGNNVVWRLRTSRPSTRCSDFELVCLAVDDLTSAPHSMLFVFDGHSMQIYKDGVRCAASLASPTPFDLSTWNADYPFVVGDELSMDRPWKGLLNRISVWDAALQPRPLSFDECTASPALNSAITSSPPAPTATDPPASTTASAVATTAPPATTTAPPTTTTPAPTTVIPDSSSPDNVTLPLGACMSDAGCVSLDACHPARCSSGTCETYLLHAGCCLYDSDCAAPACYTGQCNAQTMACVYFQTDVFCCNTVTACPPRRCYIANCTAGRCAYERNETMFDQCGVCGGDGSSCLGCDGVVNSGAVNDVCGVCNGDGGSCTLMNRELFGVFWFAFGLSLTLFLLYRALPLLVTGRVRRKPV